jgi:galactofuranosylgalactofuranosylrhamnosyl-N-acetylglucosaminyl-diphospho-decaprenol beta-1,5/1,6-galactofuranosyltransferase
VRLARKFNRMRRVYREALPVLSSKQKWEEVLLPAVQDRLAHARSAGDDPGRVTESSANG